MASNKKYWKSVEELNENSSVVAGLSNNEFVSEIPTDEFLGDKETLESSSTSRRDFLKYVGFTTAAASLAACEGPVRKSIPYVVKPDDIIPGVADYYATTMYDGMDAAHLLVKTREGRPIKIEPNKLMNGSTNARVQASVLSMYDSGRLSGPKKNGKSISWSDAQSEIQGKLVELSEAGEQIVVLSGSMASPSTNAIIADFAKKYKTVSHVNYDSISDSGALDAFEEVYGERALPSYDLSNAEVIVSIGADFLGAFQGAELEKSYAAAKSLKDGKPVRHIQVESNMSLTGANADKRIVVKPSDQVYALVNLYNAITGKSVSSKSTKADQELMKAANQLKNAGSKAVVFTGLKSKEAQLVAMEINAVLGSEIVDHNNTNTLKSGNDSAMDQLVADLNAGKVGAVITVGTNPLYTYAGAASLAKGMKKAKLSVAFAMNEDETASATTYALATPHYLESWGDVQMTKSSYGLVQPTIKPLFDTKQVQDVLLAWTGSSESYHDYLKSFWKSNVLDGTSWNKTLHDGGFESKIKNSNSKSVDASAAAKSLSSSVKSGKMELQLYVSTALGDGQQAANPWLQELPDPITRASWDNYLTMSPADANALGFTNPVQDNGAINGNYATVKVGGVSVSKVPVFIQPGQAKGSVGLAVGYGRTTGLKSEMQVGVNAYPLAQGGSWMQTVTITKEVGTHKFACEQLQHTLAGRDEILKEATLADFNNPKLDPKHSWNALPMFSYDHSEVEGEEVDLWDEHDRSIGHHFNLSIDLNSCTGCGACVVACHAENNVPVVGKHEVRVGRDMHWLRIDRYYSSEVESQKEAKELGMSQGEMYHALERVSENPDVAFQPVMCQHCNHAPCETVCPVAATSHGRQGQNQMAYNRCVGTRYCANNCPYRVRRFNWFNYAQNDEFDFNMNDDYGRMVLNPDVVVRSRGVMEKCSMCIQMTQATILQAKKEGRKVKDEEFQTACSNACSTGAMVFGDINDPESEVSLLKEDKRAYHLLAAIGTKPNVVYQVKVRNTEEG
ncbi:TAT-variant-translocated molybdopterin oxidoreductase [Flavobacteriaceae bacterium]|nr:TAT-variant-translocated molybdopterin oxidoreductase [Flavobacteriaceae bacterium]